MLGAKLRPGILRELADPDNPTYAFLRSDPRFWDLVGRPPPPLKSRPAWVPGGGGCS
ncbi:MAG: hypothetical protein ACLTC3_12620 [Evtepia gabavorous]